MSDLLLALDPLLSLFLRLYVFALYARSPCDPKHLQWQAVLMSTHYFI